MGKQEHNIRHVHRPVVIAVGRILALGSRSLGKEGFDHADSIGDVHMSIMIGVAS